MFTIGDLFEVLEPGTMVTIQDNSGYQVLNQPFDNTTDPLPKSLRARTIKHIKAGYYSFRITLYDEEE